MAYEPFLFCAHRSAFRTVPHFAWRCTARHIALQAGRKLKSTLAPPPPNSFWFFQPNLLAAVPQHCNSTQSY